MKTMDELRITNTSLPMLEINESDLYKKYEYVGHGSEGTVYKYDEKTVVKIFNDYLSEKKISMKFRKIEVLGRIEKPGMVLPRGVVGFSREDKIDLSSLDPSDFEAFTAAFLELRNKNFDGVLKSGYFMDRVICHSKYGNFDKLSSLKNTKKALEVMQKADKIMRRLHAHGFRIGDVKGRNILIDQNLNPLFIDGDNMAYEDLSYDTEDDRTVWLDETFGGKHSRVDSDIYLYTLMCLNYFMENEGMYLGHNREYLEKLVKFLKVDPVTREALSIILSDAHGKPYIGDVLGGLSQEAFTFTGTENMILTHNLKR